jgi:hypothetical protein
MIPFQQLMAARPERPRWRRRRNGVNDSASNSGASIGTVPHPDVHPEILSLRIPSQCVQLRVLQSHLGQSHENLSEQGAGSVYLNAAFNLSLLALFISFKKRTYAKAPIDSANKVKAS